MYKTDSRGFGVKYFISWTMPEYEKWNTKGQLVKGSSVPNEGAIGGVLKNREGFPGGAVVKNLPANAGDTGSSPGLGRSHVPRSN